MSHTPNPDNEQSDQAAKLLLAHRADHARTLLEEHDLPKSGTKAELATRIATALQNGSLSFDTVIARLNTIESWGRQHLYFYKLAPTFPSIGELRKTITRKGFKHLVDAGESVLIPSELTRARIEFRKDIVRICWVEPRAHVYRVEDKDYVDSESGIEYRGYKTIVRRSVNWLEIDRIAELATLSIGQLQRQGQYADHRKNVWSDAIAILGKLDITLARISTSIKSLEKQATIDTRGLKLQTAANTELQIRSAGRHKSYRNDKSARKVRDTLTKAAPSEGNFYWNLDGQGRIHAKIYKRDQRLGVFTQCQEKAVRDVIADVLKNI